jgi:hypothetical protein
MQMPWFNQFWERFAVRILVKSKYVTMVAFKVRDEDDVLIAADWSDPGAVAFYINNNSRPIDQNQDPTSMILERIYHSPDAEKRD